MRPLALTCVLLALPAASTSAQGPGSPAAEDWTRAFAWRPLGPANMGGRITDLAVVPGDPTTFWVATASAGLLRTGNKGTTFEHQFDRESVASVGAVAVAPSDPDVVYVGTGEENPRNSVSYGDGVHRSTDGGRTWEHRGLADSFQIGAIVVHPQDPDVVYVGALGRLYGPNQERGLFKSVDGGASWQRIHFVDEHTGVIDIEMNPADPDTLLFATYERQRDGFDTNDPAKKYGPGSGLWRTCDGGQTFEKLGAGLPTCTLGRIDVEYFRGDPAVVFAMVESERIGMVGDDVGFPGFEARDAEVGARVARLTDGGPAARAGLRVDDIVVRVGDRTVLSELALREALAQHPPGAVVRLEVARAGQPVGVDLELGPRPEGRAGGAQRPYGTSLGGQVANVQALQGRNGHEFGGLYRSADGGSTWARVNSINPRPMYFSQVRVDPSDQQRVYVLGISAARSEDGGATFTADMSRGVHSDQHALWIDPVDGRHMMLGTDGGLYVTYDRAATWDHLNHADLGQFYHVAVGPRRDYWVYGGLQDNGTWGAPHRSPRGAGPTNEDWLRIGGGDGFVVAVDPDDPDQIYYESQNGGMGRTHLRTMESGRIRPTAPRGTSYRFNWRTPFVLSHHNGRIYYCAGNRVFRSLHKGDDLKAISPEITRTERGSATALAESPRDPDLLYVGTDDGALFGTTDGGKSWRDLLAFGDPTGDPGAEPAADRGGPRATADGPRPLRELLPQPLWVASVEASRFADGRVYLALDGHRHDDDAPWIFVSEDAGATWVPIRGDLPRGSTRVLREDLTNPDLLYCGTEFGLYVSLDRGASWTRFHGGGLPTVAIHEIAQHRSSGEIVLATHGRSLWAAEVAALRQMDAEARAAAVHLFAPNDPVLWARRHGRGTSGGARAFSGRNPGSEAGLFFRLGADARAVRLTVRDAAGQVVRSLEAPTTAGLHRVDWDLRRDPPAGEETGRGGFRRRGGQQAEPGPYRLVLEVDGAVAERSFSVLSDPGDGVER
jgi:photosystem II stability/assembly factor-like uncharacterized protein